MPSDIPQHCHFLRSIEKPGWGPSAILRAWGVSKKALSQCCEFEGQPEPLQLLLVTHTSGSPETLPPPWLTWALFLCGVSRTFSKSRDILLSAKFTAHMLSISSQLQHMDPVTSMLSLLENILILSEKTAFTFPFSFFFLKLLSQKNMTLRGESSWRAFIPKCCQDLSMDNNRREREMRISKEFPA